MTSLYSPPQAGDVWELRSGGTLVLALGVEDAMGYTRCLVLEHSVPQAVGDTVFYSLRRGFFQRLTERA